MPMSTTTMTDVALEPYPEPSSRQNLGLNAEEPGEEEEAVRAQNVLECSPSGISRDVRDTKSKLEAFAIITVLTGITFVSVSGTGILTTALPRIATDVGLDESLIFWPASVYALSAGCTLLAFGSVADVVVGHKTMWLVGSGFSCPVVLACGLTRTGIEFLVFRAVLGLFAAMCLPTSMALVTSSFPPGTRRNVAFAATGMGQPLGYAMGLVLGGVLTDTVGWRWGFYITAIVDAVLFLASCFVLPPDPRSKRLSKDSWRRLIYDIDWVGVAILAVSFGLLSYVLAIVSQDYKKITVARNIVLLTTSILLLPVFSTWVRWRVKREKAALIPNSLWRNLPFFFICVAMFFTWAAFNAFQYTSSLFFQNVQGMSALEASIRFLPMAVVGILANFVTASLVTKVNVNTLLGTSAILTAVSPVLMAVASPQSIYWTAAFFAMCLSPINGDVLWTVSSLVISRTFPDDSQALAGAVFNTVSQLGNSVGLVVTAAIAASVNAHHHLSDENDKAVDGYRAAYWTVFVGMVLVCAVSVLGLRRVGKVGAKEE